MRNLWYPESAEAASSPYLSTGPETGTSYVASSSCSCSSGNSFVDVESLPVSVNRYVWAAPSSVSSSGSGGEGSFSSISGS